MDLPATSDPYTYVSLCTGAIAGLDEAVERVFPQARPLVYVENDVPSALRLAAAMEEGRRLPAPVWSDLRSFPVELFRGRADLVIAGFPCQDISAAGRGIGIHGERSGLFFAIMRAVRRLGPRYLFLENVAAITVRGLDAVQREVAESGFAAEWGCLRASDVGAPHGRDRWWCLAWNPVAVGQADRNGHERRPDGRGADAGADGRHHAGGAGQDGHVSALANGQSRGCGVGQPIAGTARSRQTSRTPECTGEGDRGSSLVLPGGRQFQRRGAAGALALSPGDPQGEGDQRERSRRAAGDPGEGVHGEALGHGERQSLALAGALGRNLGSECAPVERAGVEIPAWPPLPDDTDGWRAVLAEYPELAPATPAAQPAVRGVADAGPGGDRDDLYLSCRCSRTDRLRGLGNGVVPDQCAAALRALWHRAFGVWP